MTTTGAHTSERGTDEEGTGRTDRRGSLARWTIPLVLVGGLAFAACSGDGDGGTLGGSLPDVTIGSGTGVIGDGSNGADVTLPSTDTGDESAGEGDGASEPVGEDVATEPEPAPPADSAVGVVVTTDDGLTSEEWVAVVVVAIVVMAVIAGLGAVLSGRSRNRRQQQSQTQHRRDQIVGGCRWAHDQAALTVLSTNDPAMLRSTWSTVERQLLELESNIAAEAHTDGGVDADLATAGRAVSALRGALAADVAARSGSGTPAPAPDIVAQTRQTVLARNGELDAATTRLDATRV
jgi:hypothetical protein